MRAYNCTCADQDDFLSFNLPLADSLEWIRSVYCTGRSRPTDSYIDLKPLLSPSMAHCPIKAIIDTGKRFTLSKAFIYLFIFAHHLIEASQVNMTLKLSLGN